MCCYVAEQVTHWLCAVWLRCVEVRREPSSRGFSFNGIKSHRKLISWVRCSSFLKTLKHGKLNPQGETNVPQVLHLSLYSHMGMMVRVHILLVVLGQRASRSNLDLVECRFQKSSSYDFIVLFVEQFIKNILVSFPQPNKVIFF